MASFRIAVLGFGLAGKVFHCPFIAAVPGLELAAIMIRPGEHAQANRDAANAAYPQAHVVATLDEVLADPTIDIVTIATPNDTHFEFASAALRAGKHVVIDKPFAASSSEAISLIALAQQQGRVLAPFHNRRLDADFLTLTQVVDRGLIGRPVTIYSHMDRYRPLPRPNTWKEVGSASSGLLFDLGPHLLDQPLALFGVPATLSASVRRTRDTTDIEDFFEVTLSYPETCPDSRPETDPDSLPGNPPTAPGLRYIASATMLAADPAPRFRAHGTLGTYTKYGLDPQEPALLAGATVPPMGSATPWLREAEAAWGTLTTAVPDASPARVESRPYPSLTGDIRRFYAAVRDAVAGTGRLLVPTEDGYRVLRLIELAKQSSASGGQPIAVEL